MATAAQKNWHNCILTITERVFLTFCIILQLALDNATFGLEIGTFPSEWRNKESPSCFIFRNWMCKMNIDSSLSMIKNRIPRIIFSLFLASTSSYSSSMKQLRKILMQRRFLLMSKFRSFLIIEHFVTNFHNFHNSLASLCFENNRSFLCCLSDSV